MNVGKTTENVSNIWRRALIWHGVLTSRVYTICLKTTQFILLLTSHILLLLLYTILEFLQLPSKMRKQLCRQGISQQYCARDSKNISSA